MPNINLLLGQKSLGDYRKAEEEFQAKKRQRALEEQLTQRKLDTPIGAGGTDPAALRLANEYLDAKSKGDLDRANAIEMFAKTREKNVMLSEGGQYVPLAGMPVALGQLKEGEQAGTERAKTQYEPARKEEIARREAGVELETKPKIAVETERAVAKEKGRQSLPKLERTMIGLADKNQFLGQKANDLLGRANMFTTGFGGSLMSAVPGTPAYNLRADTETLLANAGFDRLQEMRDNSVTGGALGQVSERELALLQAAAQNLQNSQSPGQYKRNLEAFINQRELSFQRVQEAYREDLDRYGDKDVDAPLYEKSRQRFNQEKRGVVDWGDLD